MLLTISKEHGNTANTSLPIRSQICFSETRLGKTRIGETRLGDSRDFRD